MLLLVCVHPQFRTCAVHILPAGSAQNALDFPFWHATDDRERENVSEKAKWIEEWKSSLAVRYTF